MKKLLLIISILVVGMIYLLYDGVVEAKLLPRFRSSSSTSTKTITTRTYSTVIVTPRFLPSRNGLRVSFRGLSNATSVIYMLTYETNGKQEGVTGSINPSKGNTSRDLLFGTCSSGTCVNHLNIKNMKLKVTSKLTTGKTSIKRYSIRV